ncbi:hypothetical protein [Photobacterium atrarenae]|uniref:Cell division protein ZapA n=1 Tax=Photobacterium atrarenae TaxID=865757 RepID=A0ABY5GIM6_9GAMM|nr:hypothetical protein [Photobacterium atrarenae]UTV29137.1 hypothetical protein NNL38_07915 [Photobacterium atrarenae]
MAITIRNTDEHYYMIQALKDLTKSNVTTKALIKGAYLAVELGQQLEAEKERRIQAESELATLKATVNQYLNSQQALKSVLD